MAELHAFSWNKEESIEYAWAKLKGYRRKIIAANPSFKELYDDEALLEIMLCAVPRRYKSEIGYLNAWASLTVEEKIAALHAKELHLNHKMEHINTAFPKYCDSNSRNNLDISTRDFFRSASPTSTTVTGCLYCMGKHWARDCKYREEIQKFGIELREKDERAKRSATK